jgi:hypothetical protein
MAIVFAREERRRNPALFSQGHKRNPALFSQGYKRNPALFTWPFTTV